MKTSTKLCVGISVVGIALCALVGNWAGACWATSSAIWAYLAGVHGA